MKQPTTDKDLNAFIAQCRKRGARFQRAGKHGKLILPNGRFVVVSISPSDSRRAIKNARQQVKREWVR